MVLVDSTVWIDLLHGRDGMAVNRLRQLLDEGLGAICPVIVQEIVQGATNAASGESLRSRFSALPMLLSANAVATHSQAGLLYARCRGQGITPRSPHDCLVAQIAIEHGVALLHDDRDFDLIGGIEPALTLLRA